MFLSIAQEGERGGNILGDFFYQVLGGGTKDPQRDALGVVIYNRYWLFCYGRTIVMLPASKPVLALPTQLLSSLNSVDV